MKLAEMEVCKGQQGVEIKLFCPECNGKIPTRLDLQEIKSVNRSYQKSAILEARCPKCHQNFSSVLRLN